LRQEFHKQNAFSVPKYCAHDLASWNGLSDYWRCMPPFHGPLLQFSGYVQHPCLVPCNYATQVVIAFLTVSCQKGQRTGLPFNFVFNRKHLRHPAWTQFSKTKFIRHSFMKKWPLNPWKIQAKWRNGKSSVLLNLLFHCMHQFFINHGRSAAPQIIMLILGSNIKMSHPLPYH
jgi:hypothetical protein